MTASRRLIYLLAAWLAVIAVAPLNACVADELHNLLDEIDRAPATRAGEPLRTEAIEGTWSLVRFFAPTLVVAAAIGVCGAVTGTFVLRRGEALLALALPQAVAVGAAVGMRLGWPELPPALVAVAVALMLFARERRPRLGRSHGPTVVPAVYVSALCLSFLIIAHGGQHVEELQNLFTGIDVAVTPLQATIVAPLLLACGIIVGLLWRRWLLLAQAPATAELSGLSVGLWQSGFLAALAVYVLLGTATQGVIMVLAMLFIPATTVAPWANRLPTAIVGAVGVAVVMLAAAFMLSNRCAWPLSQSVGGVGLALLLVSRVAAVVCG